MWGVRDRALSHPRPLVLWVLRPGLTTQWLWVRGVLARGPVTKPTARPLASWLCALSGRHESPGGGASCLGVGRLGSGALRPPTARPLGRAAGAHYPLAVGAGGAGVGTRHQPHSALLRAGFARCGGGTRAPGLDPSCLGAERPGSGAHPLPTARPLGRAAGAHYPLAVGAGCVGVGTRRQPTACALASLLCALWGRHEGAQGGRLLPACGASGVGRSPTPDRPSFRACCRGQLPTGCGCGGCGRADSSPHPPRALLPAGFPRCGGGTRAPREGRLSPGCGTCGVGRSPNPDRSSFGACCRGPLPTGCGFGDCGRGDPSPAPPRALLRAGFARCRGGTRAAGGGASCLRVGRLGSGALPAPTARPLGRAAGAHYPLGVGAGGVGVGTRHQPHSARSCELALPAVGAARGRPGWTPLAWVRGVRGRALSHRRPPVLWGARPGPTTHWLWLRGVGAWGPVTNPQRALLRAAFARCGGGTRAPGGGTPCLRVGRPGSGAL